MSLQIDIALTSDDGSAIASGAHVTFQTIFPAAGYDVHFNMEFYRSVADFDAGKKKFISEEVSNMGYVVTLEPADYANLTIVGVHTLLHDYLESILGADSVSIVLGSPA